jgi:hypothetical protein
VSAPIRQRLVQLRAHAVQSMVSTTEASNQNIVHVDNFTRHHVADLIARDQSNN